MTKNDHKINSFLLTENIRVGQVLEWIKNKDNNAKINLIKLIYHRFHNRYIKHLKLIDSGFLKMAVSCLTIEALESFKQGKKNTNGRKVGSSMFKDFFISEDNYFKGFKDIADEFYKNVRCGILHQAETTNGWRILRNGALLDTKNKTINSTKFVKALEQSLNSYIDALKHNEFNTLIWKNAILKIEDVCENCNSNS